MRCVALFIEQMTDYKKETVAVHLDAIFSLVLWGQWAAEYSVPVTAYDGLPSILVSHLAITSLLS
jgi:hypothetical protein